jgi:hypothetical protein
MEQSFIANVAQMNFIIIVAVTLLAGVLVLSLYRVAVGGLTRLPGTNDSKSVIETLDVLAFNNLIDPAEEKFLREELLPSTFRSIQRLRLRAALEYVGCASRNAAVLIRMGKTFAPEAGAQRSREVQDLVTAGVHLRLLSILVVCLLWIKIAFPGLRLSLKEISTLHGRLVSQQASLSRLKNASQVLEAS